MGIPSPVRRLNRHICPELELEAAFGFGELPLASTKAAKGSAATWEPDHLVLPICQFAGGPLAGRLMAAASRAFGQAVGKKWAELVAGFPAQLFVVGGLDQGFCPVATVDRYNPQVGTWEALPPIATACAGPCAVVAGGRLYVFGGEVRGRALCNAQCFDPRSGRWQKLPPMAEGRIRAAAVALEGRVAVLGGLDGTRPMRSVEVYDPQGGRWLSLAPMQRPRYACVASVRGGRLFAFNGEITDAGSLASAEVFDRASGRWDLLPAVPTPVCGAAVTMTSCGKMAYTFGGLGLSGQALGLARQLSLEPLLRPDSEESEAPRWSPVPPMPTPRHMLSAGSYRGGVVAVGGKGPTFEAVRNVELFNPRAWEWEVLQPMPHPRLRAAVASGHL